MLIFVTNAHGHYFKIEGYDDFKLPGGCVQHESLDEMYAFVAKSWSLDMVEIECMELHIIDGKCWDDRGSYKLLDMPVEKYVADFEL